MKDLLSKEYYCYKIHTFLMKTSAYPHSVNNLPLYGLVPIFLILPSMIFLKIPTSLKISGGSHYDIKNNNSNNNNNNNNKRS